MDKFAQFEYLKSASVIAVDSDIISTHNNLVISSEADNTVFRISSLDIIQARDDPGNLMYAHLLSKSIGTVGGVLPPIDDEAIEFEGNIISRYPKMDHPDWRSVSAVNLSKAVLRLNNFPYATIDATVRRMDVASYAQSRLDSVDHLRVGSLADASQDMLDFYVENHNFSAASAQSEGLVHGDLHAGNVVQDSKSGDLLFIDLDSIAIGPKEYDLASWCVRSMRGDQAPATEATKIAIDKGELDYDTVRSMIGWKALSSITHELVYNFNNPEQQIAEIATIASSLGAPGAWGKYEQ